MNETETQEIPAPTLEGPNSPEYQAARDRILQGESNPDAFKYQP